MTRSSAKVRPMPHWLSIFIAVCVVTTALAIGWLKINGLQRDQASDKTSAPWAARPREAALSLLRWARRDLPPSLLIGAGLIALALIGFLRSSTPATASGFSALAGALIGGAVSIWAASANARQTARTQIMIATLPKRIETHQEAWRIWRKDVLPEVYNDDDRRFEAVRKADEWWDSNCLYMSDEAREAFLEMLKAVVRHPLLLEVGRNQPGFDQQVIKNWSKIIDNVHRTLLEGLGTRVTHQLLKELEPNASTNHRSASS